MSAAIVKWENARGVRFDTTSEKKSKTLKQRVEEFYGTDFETAVKENTYDYEEVDWGEPVGKEIW